MIFRIGHVSAFGSFLGHGAHLLLEFQMSPNLPKLMSTIRKQAGAKAQLRDRGLPLSTSFPLFFLGKPQV